jgi:hypothetical protein
MNDRRVHAAARIGAMAAVALALAATTQSDAPAPPCEKTLPAEHLEYDVVSDCGPRAA